MNLLLRLEILEEKGKELEDIIKCNKLINKLQSDIYSYLYDNKELTNERLNKVLKITTLSSIKNKEQSELCKVIQMINKDKSYYLEK